MEIKIGYLYHIKDEFFNVVNDENLMTNHERGRKRPTYFTIRDNEILWFIPLSSKVDKYKKVINNKVKKYGRCDTILIREVLGEESAILLQNAFPTLEKYEEILSNFEYLMKLKKKGINLFFTDIDGIKEKMLEELK